MRELHLFAGAGGGIYGGQLLGHEPVCAVEIEPFCRQVLRERQADGTFPPFPIYEDVRKFDGTPWRGIVDVVCGGFPCQPFSCAGKQLGTADPRHLWPEMARIISEVRPRYVFAENVSIKAFAEPWRDLRGMGYRVPPAICVSASDVGAPHLRKRWWLLAIAADDRHADGVDEGAQREVHGGFKAYAHPAGGGETEQMADAAITDADGDELRDQPGRGRGSDGQSAAVVGHNGGPKSMADADSKRLKEFGKRHSQPETGQQAPCRHDADGLRAPADADRAGLEGHRHQPSGTSREHTAIGDSCWWETEPNVGRVAHGVADRGHRLKALGNGQVPQCAAQAWRILKESRVGG